MDDECAGAAFIAKAEETEEHKEREKRVIKAGWSC